MKYLEWLKSQLGEELFNKHFPAGSDILKTVTEKLGEKKIIEDDGKLIPKHRFDELTTKKTELETNLATLQTEVESLRKAPKKEDKNTLEDKVQALIDKQTALEASLKEKDQQLVVGQKRSVIEASLRKMKANENYLPTLLREFELKNPLDKLEIVDGKIKDEETILKPFSESFKPMFGEYVVDGNPPKPGSGGNSTPDYDKMTDAEYFNHRMSDQNKK